MARRVGGDAGVGEVQADHRFGHDLAQDRNETLWEGYPLAQERGDAAADGGHLDRGVVVSAEHDDGRPGRDGPQPRQGGEAVGLRHVEVQDDDVRLGLFDQFGAADPVVRLADDREHPLGADDHGEQSPDLGVVIDDDHGVSTHSGRPFT